MAEGTCSVEGCDREIKNLTRMLCRLHYERFRKTGTTDYPWPEGCSVEGCGRKHYAKSYCYVHWDRCRRNGDPGPAEIAEKGVSRSCSIEGCERRMKSRGMCQMHYFRWWMHGDPMIARVKRKSGPQTWREDVGYSAVHWRVRDQRGPASGYECQHCGDSARHWAYNHQDPDERADENDRRPYSMNPDYYMPLCTLCHKRFDNSWRESSSDNWIDF